MVSTNAMAKAFADAGLGELVPIGWAVLGGLNAQLKGNVEATS